MQSKRTKTIKLISLILFVFLFLAKEGLAEALEKPFIGMSAFTLVGKKFQSECSNFLWIMSALPRPATAVVNRMYGPPHVGCLNRLYDQVERQGKDLFVEIHIWREVGRNRGHLVPGEFYPKVTDFKKINQMVETMKPAVQKEVEKRILSSLLLMRQSPRIHYALSLGLEHRWSKKSKRNLVKEIRKHWAGDIIDNPSGGNGIPGGGATIGEQHGYDARCRWKKCVMNGDGQDVNFLSNGGLQLYNPPASMREVEEMFKSGRRNGAVTLFWDTATQGDRQPGTTLDHQPRIKREDAKKIREFLVRMSKEALKTQN